DTRTQVGRLLLSEARVRAGGAGLGTGDQRVERGRQALVVGLDLARIGLDHGGARHGTPSVVTPEAWCRRRGRPDGVTVPRVGAGACRTSEAAAGGRGSTHAGRAPTSGSRTAHTAPVRPSTASNASDASGPARANRPVIAPAPSSSTPIAEFATATYSVRRSPSAMSTTYVFRPTRAPVWARASNR